MITHSIQTHKADVLTLSICGDQKSVYVAGEFLYSLLYILPFVYVCCIKLLDDLNNSSPPYPFLDSQIACQNNTEPPPVFSPHSTKASVS